MFSYERILLWPGARTVRPRDPHFVEQARPALIGPHNGTMGSNGLVSLSFWRCYISLTIKVRD